MRLFNHGAESGYLKVLMDRLQEMLNLHCRRLQYDILNEWYHPGIFNFLA